MLEFETFCYLQNQKTACTFIARFLRQFSREQLQFYEKHFVPTRRQPDKFYIISVRDPLDTYLSLFNYGLDGKGGLFGKLTSRGKSYLYEGGIAGFETWLNVILDGKSAEGIDRDYRGHGADMGYLSWRFRRLAQFGFSTAEPAMDHVIRYENLIDDLKQLARGPLAFALPDQGMAIEWLESSRPTNTSERRDRKQPPRVGRDTMLRLIDRERDLYDWYYADTRERILTSAKP